MKYLKFSIISIGVFWMLCFNLAYAQGISKRETQSSGMAARNFQSMIFSGKIDDLYRKHFDAEVKKSITNESFKKFIEDLTSTLGKRKNSILFNYKKINDDIIRVSFMSDFDRGVSIEIYYVKILTLDNYSLFRFEMTDPSKFIF